MTGKKIKNSQWILLLLLVVSTFVLFYGGPGCNQKSCDGVLRVTNNTTQPIEVNLFHESDYLGTVNLQPGQTESIQVTVIVHDEANDFEVDWTSKWLDPVVNVWADYKNGAFVANCGKVTDLQVN